MRAWFGKIAPAAVTVIPAAVAGRVRRLTVLFLDGVIRLGVIRVVVRLGVTRLGVAVATAAGAAELVPGAEPAVSAVVAGDDAACGIPSVTPAALLLGSADPAVVAINTSNTAHHSTQFHPVRRVGCVPRNCSVRAAFDRRLCCDGVGAPKKWSVMLGLGRNTDRHVSRP